MRNLVVGLSLAVLFLGLLFAAPRYLPHPIDTATKSEVSQIPPGFKGTRFIGFWTLGCSAKPPAPVAKPVQSGKPPIIVGRCRLLRGYRAPSGQLVLAVAFRLVGPLKAMTMIVRFPPVGQRGDYVLFRLGKNALRLPVLVCQPSGCVAVGALMPAAQTLLLSDHLAKVVLPKRRDGKQYIISVPLDELGPALEGLKRAEQ
jgi:invasion protein IalB